MGIDVVVDGKLWVILRPELNSIRPRALTAHRQDKHHGACFRSAPAGFPWMFELDNLDGKGVTNCKTVDTGQDYVALRHTG